MAACVQALRGEMEIRRDQAAREMGQVKIGERVFLKFSPQYTGTVSRVEPERFRVTWDDAERSRGRARTRLWYWPDALKHGMEKGAP